MKLTKAELEFLSAWAKEEWEPTCYQRPAHRLQLAHGVLGANLIDLIKSWTDSEGRKDADILQAGMNSEPPWPWSTEKEYIVRLEEVEAERAGKRSASVAAKRQQVSAVSTS